jgi:ribonuclease P protein component
LLHRVRKRSEFLRIQRTGRRAQTPHFTLLLHERETAEPGPRLGIVASRRVGGAVVRNRAKRLIREAFRRTDGLWDQALDVVIVVRRSVTGLGLSDVLAELRAHAPAIRNAGKRARSRAAESKLAKQG